MHDPLEMMTTKQLAKLLRLRPNTIDIWRRQGYGPAWTKLGTAHTSPVRYRRCDVERWLDSHGTGWEARSQGDGSLPHPQQPTRHASDGPGVTAGLCVRRYARRRTA